jgi:diguanylate cyclase (GGDEF)-like protein
MNQNHEADIMTTVKLSCLHWGCCAHQSLTLQRKIVHTNLFALIGNLSLLFYLVLCMAAGEAALIKSALLGMSFMISNTYVLYLNRQGQTNPARCLLMFSLIGSVLAPVWVYLGSAFSLHFYFLLFAIGAVLVFPAQQWRSLLLLFAINLVLFVHFEVFGRPSDPSLNQIAPALALGLRIACIVASVASILFICWYGDVVAGNNEASLECLSCTDALTRLPNRRRLQQRLSEALACSRRSGQYGALLFLDLDNFKPLNDVHGHAAGDLLLQEAARRISACVRETDMVARFGGDEYLILLTMLGPNRSEAHQHARIVAEKIRNALARPYHLTFKTKGGQWHHTHRCSASIGVALYLGGECEQETLIKQADSAMYQAKQGGCNGICCFDECKPAYLGGVAA